MSACGNDGCSCSTGIHEGLTFGRGDLDEFGYWEFPCRICAESHDRNMDAGHRDELELEYTTRFMERGMTLTEAQRRLHSDHQWLYEPAWPYC